jgi:hypothetical protein
MKPRRNIQVAIDVHVKLREIRFSFRGCFHNERVSYKTGRRADQAGGLPRGRIASLLDAAGFDETLLRRNRR